MAQTNRKSTIKKDKNSFTNGVLLRAPLNPELPADAHETVSPVKFVIVTMVLLNHKPLYPNQYLLFE